MFSRSIYAVYPAPTNGFSEPNPDTAMLFAPFGYIHPPPPVPPFLLTQNISPKDIAGRDIKLKISQHISVSLVGKGINQVIKSFRMIKASQTIKLLIPFANASR